MNFISKALAPATIIMLLGTGASPAFAAGPAPLDSERVTVSTNATTFTASVEVQGEIAAQINTLDDAKVAAEEYNGTKDIDEVTKVAQKAVSSIEDALVDKTIAKKEAAAKKAQKEADAKAAKAIVEAEKRNREAAAKAQKEADKAAAAKIKADAKKAQEALNTAPKNTIDDVEKTAPVKVDTSTPVGINDFSDAPVATSPSGPIYNDGAAARSNTQAPVATQAPITTQGSSKAKSPTRTDKPAPAPKSISQSQQKIYAAAMAQLGNKQDCTMLVTNALKSVGINFHDWPAGYKKLGTVISPSQAKPGDLIYYKNGGMGLAHIAVYAGGGKAIHGGWNGNDTVLSSANVGSGVEYIRVNP